MPDSLSTVQILADKDGLLQQQGRMGNGWESQTAILPDLLRGLPRPVPHASGKVAKMSQRFIVAGPIDGLYHVLYKVPGTIVHSSVGCSESEKLAQEEADILNGEQEKHDEQEGRFL